jgi:hypothetical protein
MPPNEDKTSGVSGTLKTRVPIVLLSSDLRKFKAFLNSLEIENGWLSSECF